MRETPGAINENFPNMIILLLKKTYIAMKDVWQGWRSVTATAISGVDGH